MEITLKGLVLSKYGSIANFSRNTGFNLRKARDIIQGRTEPTVSEAENMAKNLGITDANSYCEIFLPSLSTLWTK